jgi:aminoglycoside phosphotransferase (APT) family kinase protein
VIAAATQDPPGLDSRRLGGWLSTLVPESTGEWTAELIAGGRSNLTYEVTDGTSTFVVRRPPLGHVLATAHDMSREFRVMTALAESAVPVPETFGLCEDTGVIGAPFFVMERVTGHSYRRAVELAPLGPDRARVMSERLVDVLVALHLVDPGTVGLAEFGRPDGFLSRQVSRWKRQLDASNTRALPLAEELHRRLAESVPTESSVPSVIHGDFRLDNVLISPDDKLRAVIDWEMATLGDPLTDLALMLVYGRLGSAIAGEDVVDVASAPGFLSEEAIIERYAAGMDRDLGDFGFYLGLASFKLAAILEGIHFRYVNGQTVGDGFAGWGSVVNPLLESGLRALREHS